jgi:hypothetical protein
MAVIYITAHTIEIYIQIYTTTQRIIPAATAGSALARRPDRVPAAERAPTEARRGADGRSYGQTPQEGVQKTDCVKPVGFHTIFSFDTWRTCMDDVSIFSYWCEWRYDR